MISVARALRLANRSTYYNSLAIKARLGSGALSRTTTVSFATKKASAPRPPSATVLRVYGLNPALATVIGAQEATRAQMVKGIWDYIKEKELQHGVDKKIYPDALLLSLNPEIEIPWSVKDVMKLLPGNYNKSVIVRELTESEILALYPSKIAYAEYYSWARLNPEAAAAKPFKRINGLLLKRQGLQNQAAYFRTPTIDAMASQIADKVGSLQEDVLLPLNDMSKGPIDGTSKIRFPVASVLLLGNHSSGKSSFLNFILGADVQQTGVAPTDDGFTVITSGDYYLDRDGPSLVGDAQLGFGGLTKFGPRLVNLIKLKVRPGLEIKDVIFIDSPGMIDSPISSVNFKHGKSYTNALNIERGYDFEAVTKWMADRADVILLFFDPDKPGTTGETLSVLTNSLAGYEYKLCIILNKIDKFERNYDFARAYGSLCWNLSKVIHRKDLPRIFTTYTPLATGKESSHIDDIESMREDLMREIDSVQVKRVDNLITRLDTDAKLLNLHLSVVSHIKQKYRSLFLREISLLSLIPLSTLIFDVIYWYIKSAVTMEMAIPTCLGLTALLVRGYQVQKKLDDFQETALKDVYLERLFQDTIMEEDLIDEELKGLWKVAKPRLRQALKSLKVSKLPYITTRDTDKVDRIIEVEVPSLRRTTSHLSTTLRKPD